MLSGIYSLGAALFTASPSDQKIKKILQDFPPSIGTSVACGLTKTSWGKAALKYGGETVGAPIYMTDDGFHLEVSDIYSMDEMPIDTIKQITDFLEAHSEIVSFFSSDGWLTRKTVGLHFAAHLRGRSSLRRLDIHYNRLSEDNILQIVEALRDNKTLEFLNIRANRITDKVLDALLAILKTENTTLRQVELSQDNGREKSLNQETLRNIHHQLIINYYTRRFSDLSAFPPVKYASGNALGAPMDLSEFITQEVNFSKSPEIDATVLLSAQHPSTTLLVIKGERLTEANATAVAQYLENNPSLHTLELDFESVEPLKRKVPSLWDEICAGLNPPPIKDENALDVIINALGKNRMLQSIRINANLVSKFNLEAITEILREENNTTLKQIEFTHMDELSERFSVCDLNLIYNLLILNHEKSRMNYQNQLKDPFRRNISF